MATIQFLANMNISPQTVRLISGEGWNIVRIPEVTPPTSSDEQILDWARQAGRVVLTQDLDFSALLAVHGHAKPSVITVRTRVADPAYVAKRIMEVIPVVESELENGSVITILDSTYRVRNLPLS